MSEAWMIMIAMVVVGFVSWALQGMVIKRIDRMEKRFDENIEAHEKLWTEHNTTKLELCQRITKIEEKVDVEQSIKKLLTTT